MKEVEYIEYFIANERKQKRLTLTVAVFFTLFAITLIGAGFYIQTLNKKITDLNLQHKEDSIKNLKKTNLRLKKDSAIITQTYNRQVLNDPGMKQYSADRPYTVYIQYTSGSGNKSKAEDIQKELLRKQYNAPGIQLIDYQKYNSCIRYFDESAKEEANKIAGIGERVSKIKFEMQLVNLRAPKKQIELWISDNSNPDSID